MNKAEELGIRLHKEIMVYRYFNEQYGLEALQKQEWKVSRLLDLNDPMDCRPVLTNYPTRGTKEADEAFEQSYLDEISKVVGVICYSAKIQDPVIWSHYADAHKGLALGFNFEERDLPLKMAYGEARPALDFVAVEAKRKEGPLEALMEIIRGGFLVKASSWGHEDEYRQFPGLEYCEMKGPHYFAPMPKTRLGRVVLGVRCRLGVEDVRRIFESAAQRGRHYPTGVDVVKARINPDTFAIRIC